MDISIVTISTAFAEEGNNNANADAAVANPKFRRDSDTAPSSSLGNAQRGERARDGDGDIVDIIVAVNASV